MARPPNGATAGGAALESHGAHPEAALPSERTVGQLERSKSHGVASCRRGRHPRLTGRAAMQERAMDSLPHTVVSAADALALRYGAEHAPAHGPWNDQISLLLSHRSIRGYRPDP